MKRRGFTLIELMVVIAIIIILAAIAIPNYLNMTKRAKNSRLASDMATLATGLETFKTDWGVYPVSTSAVAVNLPASIVYAELSGTGAGQVYNKAGATNAVGETNGAAAPFIEYIKAGTLASIINPFGLPSGAAQVMYKSTAAGAAGAAQTWTLYAQTDTGKWLVRTDSTSTAVETASTP